MNHPRPSLTTLSALAVAVGLAACGGGTKQTQGSAAPVATTSPPQPTPGAEQYGSAMGQPGMPSPNQPEIPTGQGSEQPGAMTNETGAYGGPRGTTGGGMAGPTPGGMTNQGGTMGNPPSGGMNNPPGAEPSAPGGAMAEPSMTPPQGATGTTGSSMDVSSLDDAQLAAVVQSIHSDQMQAAQLAMSQASSPEVKRFAKEMLTQHKQMQGRVSSLLSRNQMTPSENAVSNQIKADGQSEMSMLQGEHGKDFDRDYIDAEVRDHNHALELMDRMIASAKNPELKTALQNGRAKIEQHLSEAERIQSSLQKGQTNKQRKNPGSSTGPNPY